MIPWLLIGMGSLIYEIVTLTSCTAKVHASVCCLHLVVAEESASSSCNCRTARSHIELFDSFTCSWWRSKSSSSSMSVLQMHHLGSSLLILNPLRVVLLMMSSSTGLVVIVVDRRLCMGLLSLSIHILVWSCFLVMVEHLHEVDVFFFIVKFCEEFGVWRSFILARLHAVKFCVAHWTWLLIVSHHEHIQVIKTIVTDQRG